MISRFPARSLAVLCLLLMFCCSAHAEGPRTWISGVGDDANPARRTAPDKTFAGAISKTTSGGEIDALDPGGFGAVTITKSVTLDGGSYLASINFSGVNGVVINAKATDVVILRRLSLTGGGTGVRGVRVLQAGRVVLEDCYISNFTDSGVEVNVTANTHLVLINTQINAGPTGVKVTSTAGSNVSLDNVQITNTTNAIDLRSGTLDVSNSLITQNTGVGLLAEGGTLNSMNNVVTDNGQDVQATGGVVNTYNTAGRVGISLTQDSSVATVSAGQSAVFNLTVAPPPGGFSAPVTFSTAGLPSNLSCTFDPVTVPAGSGPTPVQMTVTAAQALASVPYLPSLPPTAGLAAAAALGLWLTVLRRPRVATLGALVVVLACGSFAYAAPVTGTFSFTVTATSGTSSVSQLFTVTVQ